MGYKGGGAEWVESEGMKSSLAYQAEEESICHVILSGNLPEDVAILLLTRPSS